MTRVQKRLDSGHIRSSTPGLIRSSAATQEAQTVLSGMSRTRCPATLASYNSALALDMLKEGPLLWPVDVPEAEIILVPAHLTPAHLTPSTTNHGVK